MDEISSAQLKQDVADILQGSDITTVTSKKIRKQLEEKYQCDLIERKAEIDKLCLDEIVLLTSKKSENSKTNGKDENGSEASGGSDDDNNDDDDDSDNDGPPGKKAKKPSSSGSKKHGSDDDDNDDDEVDDADLARRLQEEEEENGVRKTRHGSKPQKMKKKRKKAKSSDEGSEDEESSGKKKKKSKGPGRTNKYTEPCYLSPQLSAIMNETRLKRSDVVKKMWAIVKERNLYDPKNKQFMICDEQMQTVFACKRVRIFGMMKVLKNHIFSPDEYENRS